MFSFGCDMREVPFCVVADGIFGCGDGAIGDGAWSAEMAEAAEGPDLAESAA